MNNENVNNENANKKDNQKELNLEKCVKKYSDFPRFIMIKIDVQRRGVAYTDRAIELAKDRKYQPRNAVLFGDRREIKTNIPESLLLRDGTSIITGPSPIESNPYTVDIIDDKIIILDNGKYVEECEFWHNPEYYGKKTSKGTPMELVMSARPQRLSVCPYLYCHFWDNDKGCKYCDIVPNLEQMKKLFSIPTRLDLEDLNETVHEALKEQGKWTGFCITSGSDPRGDPNFQSEVNMYLKVLKVIGGNFKTKKWPGQLIATAFSEEQLDVLADETGVMSYTSDIEVWDEKLFKWICPGKDEWIGQKEWIRRLIAAVDIFGEGCVSTSIVAGAEMAKPYGFDNEDDAIKSCIEGAEYMCRNGVGMSHTVWVPRYGSKFQSLEPPSLEYYIRIAQGLHDARKNYGMTIDFDDYRRCGNHPDTDLERLR